MILPPFIKSATAGGAALLLGSAAAWTPSGLSEPLGAAPMLRVAPEPLRVIARCGGGPAAGRPAVQPLLPNAYMIANGRVFALGGVLACAKRLHTARFT